MVLDTQLAAGHGAWEMQADGTYVRSVSGEGWKSSQLMLVDQAEKRQKEASRRRKRRPRGFARRAAK